MACVSYYQMQSGLLRLRDSYSTERGELLFGPFPTARRAARAAGPRQEEEEQTPAGVRTAWRRRASPPLRREAEPWSYGGGSRVGAALARFSRGAHPLSSVRPPIRYPTSSSLPWPSRRPVLGLDVAAQAQPSGAASLRRRRGREGGRGRDFGFVRAHVGAVRPDSEESPTAMLC